jgi:phosphoribosylformimino-5-aminoimidazole carboxamide ribotide isomerase
MMVGPNFERTKELAEAVAVGVVASGGVSKIDDIKKLAETKVVAAIIGRSLYEGSLDLSDAINAAK